MEKDINYSIENEQTVERHDGNILTEGVLRSPPELFEETFRILKEKIFKALGFIFLPIVIFGIFALVTFLVGIMAKMFLPDPVVSILTVLLVVIILAFLFFFIYFLMLTNASLYFLVQDKENKTPFFTILKKSKKYAIPLFVVSLINTLFIFLWGVLFIIPGFIFFIYYSLSKWAYALEGFTGTSALKRSKELIKGHWWAILYRLSFFIIPSIVLYILAMISEGNMGIFLLISILSNVLSILIPIVMMVYLYLIYQDLYKIIPESKIEKKGKKAVVIISIVIIAALALIIPLLFTLSTLSLNNAREKSRDARRISDIKQIQTGLEQYYSDAGHYPEKIVPGLIFHENSTTYMSQIPRNPTPNDGVCDENFQYEYIPSTDFLSYDLMYCLGNPIASFNAGINTATPAGM